MTHEQKIKYMEVAAGIVGYGFDNKSLDMLVSIYELVIEKQGKTDLKMCVDVKHQVIERDNVKKRSELLDKVSKKIP